jgi:hypothetical protein
MHELPELILFALAPRYRSDDEQRLRARCNRVRQRCIRRLVRDIPFACEEPYERSALLRDLIANGPAKGGVGGLERVENRALCDRTGDVALQLCGELREPAQRRRQHYPDHVVVISVSESRERLNLDGQHGRQVPHDGRPVVSGVGRCVHLTAGRAEVNAARIQ